MWRPCVWVGSEGRGGLNGNNGDPPHPVTKNCGCAGLSHLLLIHKACVHGVERDQVTRRALGFRCGGEIEVRDSHVREKQQQASKPEAQNKSGCFSCHNATTQATDHQITSHASF